MFEYINARRNHHSRCSICIPWVRSREFEAAVTPTSVLLPAAGFDDLSDITKSTENCMVNVIVDSETQVMLGSIPASKPQELISSWPEMVNIDVCWRCLAV